MDNVPYSIRLQCQETSFIDDETSASTGGRTRRVTSSSSLPFSTYRLLEGLSPYATVFGCTGTCDD